jgi:hypothetical protein
MDHVLTTTKGPKPMRLKVGMWKNKETQTLTLAYRLNITVISSGSTKLFGYIARAEERERLNLVRLTEKKSGCLNYSN